MTLSAATMIEVGSRAGVGTLRDETGLQEGEKLVKGSDCSSCHAVDRQVVGPSYSAVAKRYEGQADAAKKLAGRIRDGGSGNWGDVPMTPHPSLKDAQLLKMAEWILSLKEQGTAKAGAESKSYTHTLKDGKTVQLDFPLFVEGQGPKVTKDVFRGYLLFNSYCYRCHGQDATGGELAPDLRRSLGRGMKQQEFFSVAMAGREEKGMPSWAGFFSEDEIRRIYSYTLGRSLDLISIGRPPSETD